MGWFYWYAFVSLLPFSVRLDFQDRAGRRNLAQGLIDFWL